MQKTIITNSDGTTTKVILEDLIVDDNQRVLARMHTELTGDGKTPNIGTFGNTAPIGYNDDGTAILPDKDDVLIDKRQKEFMAVAIKEQKELTKDKGGDPSKVNIIGAETDTTPKPTARQTLDAGMMKDIASLKIQVAELQKGETTNAK